MLPFPVEQVGLGFDMHGCPNGCRHCFVGPPSRGGVTEEQVRRLAGDFRAATAPGTDRPAFGKVWVSTSIREPDFADDYRRLYELERALSDGPPRRYELLSVWRLARDKGYAEWAKSIGPDICQISFFGEEETTDWFCRRKGAFRDGLAATERLLDVGMKPRWQIFANSRGIPEFGSLLGRIDAMRLRERVAALGGSFDVFVHPYGPSGEARCVEHLRPTDLEMAAVPAELLASTRRHFQSDCPWHTEAELYGQIMSRPAWHPYGLTPGPMPWFFVTGGLDVYYNACDVAPWFRLGNLKGDSWTTILDRLVNRGTPGLRTIYEMAPQELARRHGDPAGRRVYSGTEDLQVLYIARHYGAAARCVNHEPRADER